MPELPQRLTSALAERYRIERELGAGGMATVYLAEDLKHDRQVAIKVLRPELAAVIGAERFLREIKTIANLSHPHILGLIDSGEVNGTAYYVMPFVEGESLRDRLTREKQLPVSDAVRLATEVAGALDYAHRHGVIHRDIKPENVMLHDGRALVADFGIALAVSSGSSTRMTETGMSLGTPHYMSPEQAMGEREITARSDVYALGAMTYEMLVGEPPFTGPTAQAIIAKVMTTEPVSLTSLRRSVPVAVEAAVLTALEKLPADRFATAAEFAAALEGRGAERPGSRATLPARPPVRPKVLYGALALTTLATVGLALQAWRRPAVDGGQTVRFTMDAVIGAQGYSTVAVSPDGRTLVYVGVNSSAGDQWSLVVRALDETVGRPLPGTENAANPFFSPDGKWVGFIRGNQLFKIALSGSAPQRLALAPGTFDGVSWARDGRLIVSGNRAFYSVPQDGGEPQILPGPERLEGELFRTAPLVLPDGRHVLYASWNVTSVNGVRLAVLDLKTGQGRILELPGLHPLGMVDDILVYVNSTGVLMGARVDLDAARVLGAPVQLAENITINTGTGLARAALSPAGTLIYQTGSPLARVMVVGPEGRTRLGPEDNRPYGFPRLSPDGRRLAIGIEDGGRGDIWLYHLTDRTFTRLTTSGVFNQRPEWTPDGRRVLFRSEASGHPALWWRPIDLSAEAMPLLDEPGHDIFEGVLTPDGKQIIYQLDTLGADIYYRNLTGDSTAHPVARSGNAVENMPRLSPDGHWVAFVTDESGREEVVVQPFPGPGGRTQVSNEGGTEPVWARDGRRLFYRGSGHLMAATIRPGPDFSIAARDSVLPDDFLFALNPHANWDVMPDGKHFLFLEPSDGGTMTVTANWLAVLRARMTEGGAP